MTYILKKLSWNLHKRSIEHRIMDYCRIEYRPSDVDAAFNEAMRQQEQYFMSSSK